jgi:hypothetical protein
MARKRRVKAVAAVACGVAAIGLAGAPGASADSVNWHKVLSEFQLGPFNLAVNQQKV